MKKVRKIGIMGGTFDPIHIGHLALANYLCEYEGLDEIWFMTSPQNPLKAGTELWPDELRLRRLRPLPGTGRHRPGQRLRPRAGHCQPGGLRLLPARGRGHRPLAGGGGPRPSPLPPPAAGGGSQGGRRSRPPQRPLRPCGQTGSREDGPSADGRTSRVSKQQQHSTPSARDDRQDEKRGRTQDASFPQYKSGLCRERAVTHGLPRPGRCSSTAWRWSWGPRRRARA